MIRFVLTSALLLLIPGAPALAQQPAPDMSQEHRGGAGFIAIGTNVGQFGSLNNRLRASGYPSFDTRLLSLGGGGYRTIGGRFLLGGEGYGVLTPSNTSRGRRVSLGGGYGLATIGYLAVAHSKWQVYPQVGAGLGGFSVRIGNADNAAFEDVLDDPNRESELNRGQFLLSLSLQGAYTFRSTNEGGFHVGLQAGYLFAPADGDWTLDGNSLDGGPEAGFDGPFLRLLIGGGSIR